MKQKFNVFLLQFLLSQDLVSHFQGNNDIKQVIFQPTLLPDDATTFFAQISATDLNTYLKFSNSVIRVDIIDQQDSIMTLYVFLRNGRENRPEIGTHKYSFTRPSSIEIGFVNKKGEYISKYKKHYSDWFADQSLEIDSVDYKMIMKTIEYHVINAIVSLYNSNHPNNVPISTKPLDNNGYAQVVVPVVNNVVSSTPNVAPEVTTIKNNII